MLRIDINRISKWVHMLCARNVQNIKEITLDVISVLLCTDSLHDNVIKWKPFSRCWSSVNSPHKDQWRGVLMFSLICAWTNARVHNRDAGDLRHHRAHYDVAVMLYPAVTGRQISHCTVYWTFTIIYLNSAVWALSPHLGWAEYEPEPYGVTCSLDWDKMSLSYVIAVLIVNYILPIAIMGYSYGAMAYKFYKLAWSMRNQKHRKDIYMVKVSFKKRKWS